MLKRLNHCGNLRVICLMSLVSFRRIGTLSYVLGVNVPLQAARHLILFATVNPLCLYFPRPSMQFLNPH